MDYIPIFADGASASKVDIALRGRLRLDRHQKSRNRSGRDDFDVRMPAQLISDSLKSVARSAEICRLGQFPEDDVHMFTCIATQADPSLAPDGQDTLYLYAPITPVNPVSGWETLESKASDRIVAKAAEFFDSIDELESDAARNPPPRWPAGSTPRWAPR